MPFSLWRKFRFVLQFMLTAAAPILLFCGIACFSANEIYVWYLMHSKSLIAAFASFLCILLLYLLAVPMVFSAFQERPPQTQSTQAHCTPHHDIIHEHHDSKDDDTLAKALILALEKCDKTTEKSKEIETNQELRNVASQLIAQLDEIHKLKNADVILEEEYNVLKGVILVKLNKVFKVHINPVD
eukprot:Seg187.10 transcript_id=Seg187.10/GoldUCD/mRNA.D3Y31 product="hypothetical protein" protein_id=Seg187.10/GoldUCD/D3Y31